MAMTARRAGELAVRVGLPVLLVVAGIVLLIVGHGTTSAAGLGVVLLGVALMVILIDWLYHLSIESNRDREREEQARDYFTRTGHWPDELLEGQPRDSQRDQPEDRADQDLG
jgi:hypothetical protein